MAANASAEGFDLNAGIVGVEYENLDSTCIGGRSTAPPIYSSASVRPGEARRALG
jgi:hypothetical protein